VEVCTRHKGTKALFVRKQRRDQDGPKRIAPKLNISWTCCCWLQPLSSDTRAFRRCRKPCSCPLSRLLLMQAARSCSSLAPAAASQVCSISRLCSDYGLGQIVGEVAQNHGCKRTGGAAWSGGACPQRLAYQKQTVHS